MRRAPSWVLNFCWSVPACLETLNPGPPSSGPGFVPRNEHIFMADHYMITIDQRFGNPWNLENHDGLPWCVCCIVYIKYNYIHNFKGLSDHLRPPANPSIVLGIFFQGFGAAASLSQMPPSVAEVHTTKHLSVHIHNIHPYHVTFTTHFPIFSLVQLTVWA